MADTDRNGTKPMSNVRMLDKLDRAMDLITVLGAFFRAADSDANECRGGLQYITEEIFKDVSEVYEALEANKDTEAEKVAGDAE